MPTLEIKREQPKARVITMGQPDREIEYERYYPPGATEPIMRKKQPVPAEPVTPLSPPSVVEDPPLVADEIPEPKPAEDEYGDGVRVNEKGEKVIEFGTLNKKPKSNTSPPAPKVVNGEQREKKNMANEDKDLSKAGTKTIREDKASDKGAIGNHGANSPAQEKVPKQGEAREEKK